MSTAPKNSQENGASLRSVATAAYEEQQAAELFGLLKSRAETPRTKPSCSCDSECNCGLRAVEPLSYPLAEGSSGSEAKQRETGGSWAGAGPVPVSDPYKKTCSKCKEVLTERHFFRDKSKPDGLYSQCKGCASAEEKKRLAKRGAPALPRPPSSYIKKCCRCKIDKPALFFCQNKRSADGLYSQCRDCVAEKDKQRQQNLKLRNMAAPPELVAERREKYCTACSTTKPHDAFYRDISKQDGLQTYCKPCLLERHKATRVRKRQRSSGAEQHQHQHHSGLGGLTCYSDPGNLGISYAGAYGQVAIHPDIAHGGYLSAIAGNPGISYAMHAPDQFVMLELGQHSQEQNLQDEQQQQQCVDGREALSVAPLVLQQQMRQPM